ncbi:MAG TPA: PAS domain S-box protein [Anaerolineae bacterium]|nr:PAS domain S-box protein [Anaerolineae bacterium]HMR63177.1 PAS domain S-box protein [Anaerolineae bacterium]
MAQVIQILHLEDDPVDAELIQAKIEAAGLTCQIICVKTRDEFEAALRQGGYDLILADYRLPMYDGTSALRLAQELCPDVPFIFVSGTMGEQAAIEGLTEGATDYVLKQRLSRLASAISRALHEAESRRERRRVEAELRKLSRAVEQSTSTIVITDIQGYIEYANPQFTETTGYTLAEAKGQHTRILKSGHMPPEAYQRLWETITAGQEWRGEFLNKKKSGELYWESASISPIKTTDGTITHFLAVKEDITKRKHAEKEREVHLWFLESLDQVNQAMQGTNDLEQMMRDVLDVLLTVFECDRASLIYPCDPEAVTWQTPMERTRPEYPGVLPIGIDLPLEPVGAEVYRILRATGGPVQFGPEAEHPVPAVWTQVLSIQSFIAMALYPKVGLPWSFSLHQCSCPRVWAPEVERLFQEIGRRLSDALSSLLTFRNLRESERKLAEAERLAHVGYWDRDYEADSITLSDEACRIFGLPVEGQPWPDLVWWHERWQELIHPEDRSGPLRATEAALRRGPRYDVEYRVIRPSGEVRFVRSQGDVTWGESGQPRRMFGIMQDITELRQAEDKLRASEERFRALYHENPSVFFTLSAEGTIIAVNDFGASQLGYTKEELEGLPVLNVFYEEDKAALCEQLEICLQNPWQVYHRQFRKVRKDGSLMWVEEFARAVKRDGVIYVLIVCQDITERKQLAVENEQLAAQFYQAQKMESIGRLAGGIAHDFNNLLVPIMGYVDMNLASISSESRLYKDLTEVRKAADRAANLTRQILAFSRQQVLELSLLDLNVTIDEFKKMLHRLIGEDIELQTFLSPLYPIMADRGQIEQVLMNLVINSRDAMPAGGKLTIETANVFLDEAYLEKHASDLKPGRYVMLAVSDTGQGMAAETCKRIFEPFFTTKESGKGTGLGLATVFGIIKQHQGHIWVYSEPGQGTTFKIYLPHANSTIQQTTTPVTKDPLSVCGTETVLVVEDEEMVRKFVCETLEAHGYDVVEAPSPGACLELASGKTTIDLLLTDVIMPEMNGKDLYQKIAVLHPNSRVLYMSGYINNVVARHSILDEGINFLQKPFTVCDLTRKVREVLN